MTRLSQQAFEWAQSQAVTLALGQGDAISKDSLRQLLKSAASMGWMGIQVPREQGGLGLSFSDKVAVVEALARVDFGLSMAIVNSHNVAEQLVRLNRAGLMDQVVPGILSGDVLACTALTEPGAGSDFAAIQTVAQPMGEGWRLDGDKAWIINAWHADGAVVYAQTQSGSGAAGIAAFWVEAGRDGWVRTQARPMGPLPLMGTGAFQLRGYHCLPDECVSPPTQAFKDIMHGINAARCYVAAMCCGMVAQCLSVAAGHGHQRSTFGLPLKGHQGWRWILAEAHTDLAAAQALVRIACQHIDAGLDARLSAAHAKVLATRMAQTHIGALAHAMGAEGLQGSHPFLRHLKAAQVATLTDGSTEMLLELIARTATDPVSDSKP